MDSLTKLSLLLLCLALGGCEDAADPAEEPSNTEPSQARVLDPCETTHATYETVGEPFMRTWCTPCHHSELSGDDRPLGSEGVNLDTYTLVVSHLERIEARALGESPTMPPAGGPSPEDLERLAFWLECGAVETLPERPPSE